ncbi:MAG: HAMP domain-containing sensor histidine kinase [Planctomycetaceae bacterium]
MLSSRLFRKVFVAYAMLSILGALVTILLITNRVRHVVNEQVRQRLHDTAAILLAEYEENFPSSPSPALQSRLARYAKKNGIRITLVAADGVVIGDSEYEPETLENHRNRDELLQARATGEGSSNRNSPTSEIPMMYYAIRVGTSKSPGGFIRMAFPLESVNRESASVIRIVWVTTLAANLLALVALSLILSRIIRPIEELTSVVQSIATGEDLNQSVEVNRQDEIGALADAFNSMTKQLSTRIEEFRQKQKELEESGKLLQTVFGTMVEGVLAVDRNQNILFANRAAGELLDLNAENIIGRPVWEVARSGNLQEAVRKVLEERPQERREFQLPRTKNITMLVASRLPGEPCPGAVLVLHDVTELRRLENLRRDFVSSVSHELKTPLASIQAYAETLQNGALDDPVNSRKFVKRIEEQSERLHSLILDLLSLARIESAEDAFDAIPLHLEHVIRECIDDHQTIARSNGISLSFDPPREDSVFVLADPEAMRTIIDNLVDNAINYTPAGGSITIRMNPDHEQESVRLDVTDTGVGIAREHQERIFERFYRADKARSRELGGTGLGLAIVKHLAQVFGGRVELESTLGQGSTFSVILPLLPKSKNGETFATQ